MRQIVYILLFMLIKVDFLKISYRDYPEQYEIIRKFDMNQHVAIKCTYNNGNEGAFVGFNGTCSENIIKLNIDSGRVWCSRKECDCRKYYDRGFRGHKPTNPCYESMHFRYWKYGAGWYHTGKRAETPIHMSKDCKGKIAISTTRFPRDKEIDRKIIGLFKISNVIEEREKETILVADKEFRIRLPLEEAKELFFWNYYYSKGNLWRSGLFRYLDSKIVSRILFDLKETIRDKNLKAIITKLLEQDFPGIIPPSDSDARVKRDINRTKRVATVRKYGAGGEGAEHRKLKEWIAKNPHEIGFTGIQKTEVEYVFPSGDTVDILFKLSENREIVVEIETTDPLPGCYQALKYKVLRCAERGISVNSPKVSAILVAWKITQEVKEFCNKYRIKFIEKKL